MKIKERAGVNVYEPIFLAGGCSELAELAKSQLFGPGAMFTNQSSFLRKKN